MEIDHNISGDDRESLGKTIKEQREMLGKTQKEIADKAKASAVYISQMENGNRNVTLEIAPGLAKALQLDTHDFVRRVIQESYPGIAEILQDVPTFDADLVALLVELQKRKKAMPLPSYKRLLQSFHLFLEMSGEINKRDTDGPRAIGPGIIQK